MALYQKTTQLDKYMKLYSDHLDAALVCAIRNREVEEKALGYHTDSIMVAVWRECLKELRERKLPRLEARFP